MSEVLPDPFGELVREHPGPGDYPAADFRLDFGPVFHRGRLDGSARVVVLGEAPGDAESSLGRVFVGRAGQVVQGLLAKLGIDRSYAMVNCFLYKAGDGAERHVHDPVIAAYRHRWLDALLIGGQVEAVVGIGPVADDAFQAWHETEAGGEADLGYVPLPRPPGSDDDPDAVRTALVEWNQGLDQLYAVIQYPDEDRPLAFYGDELRPDDLAPIPVADLSDPPREE
jgi:hypothetical protein